MQHPKAIGGRDSTERGPAVRTNQKWQSRATNPGKKELPQSRMDPSGHVIIYKKNRLKKKGSTSLGVPYDGP